MTALLTPLMVALGSFGVLLLAAVLVCESGVLLGFFLPGDALLFSAGLLTAAGRFHLPLLVVLAIAVAAAVLGDQLGYSLGRRLGPSVFSGRLSRFLAPRHVERAQRFFDRHGTPAVALARFVPVVRTLVPFLAGAASMPRRRFAPFNAVGGAAWVSLSLLAGFYLGGVPFVAQHVELVVLGVVVASTAPFAVVGAARWWRRRSRAEQPHEVRVSLSAPPARQ